MIMKILSIMRGGVIVIILTLPMGGCAQQNSKPKGKPKNPYYSMIDTTKLRLDDDVWKNVLSDSVYRVARKGATEYAFTGKYWNYFGLGNYHCAACGNALFKSDSKFSSSCGWPSFFQPLRKHGVLYVQDDSYGMDRVEVKCGRCNAHLGHIFDDGPPPTGKRFCMNSIVLDFIPDLKTQKKAGL
jgi:peptide-methionine (R)-S-oxide reductase